MADPIYEKMLNHIEKSVNEQEGGVHLAGKFGVFGYDDKDENVYYQYYNTEEEAIEDAKLLSQEEVGEELTYVEVWQANEKGEFGGIEGSNLIWKSDAPENESKVDEQEVAEKKLADYSVGELEGLVGKLDKVIPIFPAARERMKEVQGEIERRKEDKKND